MHALPLRLRREAIGALNLFHRNPGPLPEADLLLGQALDLTAATTPAGVRVARLLGELARRGRWLVVFDSAEDPRTVPVVARGARPGC